MHPGEMRDILSQVRYKDWQFNIIEKTFNRYFGNFPQIEQVIYLQVSFPATCLVTGKTETQRGRKWHMSTHMTKSEVVCTAFKAAITAEEHECRESFRYKGRMIFGPHFDVDALASIAVRSNMDTRSDMEAEATADGV